MSVVEILETQVDVSAAEEFAELFERELEETRTFPGNQRVEFYRDLDDPSRCVVILEWNSREDQAAYSEWRRAGNITQRVAELLGAGSAKFTFLRLQRRY
jgi:heme-degrading monooxygenase HmoA